MNEMNFVHVDQEAGSVTMRNSISSGNGGLNVDSSSTGSSSSINESRKRKRSADTVIMMEEEENEDEASLDDPLQVHSPPPPPYEDNDVILSSSSSSPSKTRNLRQTLGMERGSNHVLHLTSQQTQKLSKIGSLGKSRNGLTMNGKSSSSSSSSSSSFSNCKSSSIPPPPRVVQVLSKSIIQEKSTSTTNNPRNPSDHVEQEVGLTTFSSYRKSTWGLNSDEDNVEHIVSNFKIIVRRAIVYSTKITTPCTICGLAQDHKSLGFHLFRKHKIREIQCPGTSCSNIKYPYHEYWKHVESFHSKVHCSICDIDYDSRRYRRHMAAHGLPQNITNPQVLRQKIKETEKNGNSIVSDSNSVSIVNESTNPVTNDSQTILKPESIGEYLMEGDIVIVDGISYLIRDFNIFVDCPFCEISCASSVMGPHFLEDHKMSSFNCFAKECRLNVPSQYFQNHLFDYHGTLKCKKCNDNLTISEVKFHIKLYCPKLKVQSSHQSLLKTNRLFSYNVPGIACPYCHKICANVNKHITQVHKVSERCHVCNKIIGQNYLFEHIKTHHSGQSLLSKKCPICYVTVQNLKNHFKYVHKLSTEETEKYYQEYIGNNETFENNTSSSFNHRKSISEEDSISNKKARLES